MGQHFFQKEFIYIFKTKSLNTNMFLKLRQYFRCVCASPTGIFVCECLRRSIHFCERFVNLAKSQFSAKTHAKFAKNGAKRNKRNS